MAPYGVYGDASADLTDWTDGEELDRRPVPLHAPYHPIEFGDMLQPGRGIYAPVPERMPPPVDRGAVGGFLDRLAENIAAGGFAHPHGRQSDSQTLLTHLLSSTGQGFARQRLEGRDEQKQQRDVLERAAAARNARNLAASEAARADRVDYLKTSSKEQREKRQREEGWVAVPNHIARALGDEGLTGKRVSPEVYKGYLEIWRKTQDADKGKIVLIGPSARALGVPDGTPVTVGELADLRRAAASGKGSKGDGDGEKPLTRREQLKLLDRLDTATARIGQMNRRLAELRGAKSPNKMAIAKIEGDLGDVEAERDAAATALQRAGLSPVNAPAGGGTDSVSPQSTAPAKVAPDSASAGRVASLKRAGKAAQQELKATGALSAQRRQQAQAKLNEIERELQTLGASLNTIPTSKTLDLQAPIQPAANPAAKSDVDRTLEAARKAGVRDRESLQGWLEGEVSPGLSRRMVFKERGVLPALLSQFGR